MDLTSGSVFTLNDNDYIILEDTHKNNKHYLFVNKLKGEEPTKEYYCLEEDDGEVVILKVEDSEEDSDQESYVSVESEETLMKVFNIFKDKFKDEFDFVDSDE